MMSDTTGVHFEGLAQAARHCRKHNDLSSKLCKKLINLDYTYNCVRHITKASIGALTLEV